MAHSPKTVNIKSLERSLQQKEYVKVIQMIGTQYETLQEHFLLVEAYIGLGRFDLADKFLINWQSKLTNQEDWVTWCYLYARSLFGMKNKKDALTTLAFANDFLKTLDNEDLKSKIVNLRKEITNFNY